MEKITDFSEGGKDSRSTLSICHGCILKTSPYALCFYRDRLNKGVQDSSSDDKYFACSSSNQVTVMFISRDPNITIQEIIKNPHFHFVSGNAIDYILNLKNFYAT